MLPAIVLALAAVFAQSSANSVELRPGPWRAWLDSPGGELPFGLELKRDGGAWKAWLINGDDRAEVPRVNIDGDELVLSIPHYASTIRAKITEKGERLDGQWTKRGRNDKVVKLPFHAAHGAASRFRTSGSTTSGPLDWFEGRWSMRFAKDSESAVLLLNIEPNGRTTGSILTPTGDYGFLEGSALYFERPPDPPFSELRLSTFDGAHAFVITGRFQVEYIAADCGLRVRNVSLSGDFWSGDTYHDTFAAARDASAALPDPFAQTQFSAGVKLDDLKFPDLQGKMRSLAEPAFAGKARIVEVFGSWCPNCNDASRYLVELHRKYKDRGLSIVGLAFEYTGDFAVDAEQVKAFAKYHEIEYPLLLAGVADREKASAALPIIDKLRAYPTIILLDAQGKGRAVYTGFSGPATGEEYAKFKAKFEALIEDVLSAPSAGGN